jgi:hypothetical protein
MASLPSILLNPSRRAQVVADFVHLIDTEVQNKGGLTGIAVKGAYAITKKIKPGIVGEVMDKLADSFADKLDPFYQDHQSQGLSVDLVAYFLSRAPDIAQALLSITDARAQASDNRTMRSTYEKLRPTGVKHVEAAVPGIAKIIKKYV